MNNYKCDLCGQEKKVKRFSRRKLRKSEDTLISKFTPLGVKKVQQKLFGDWRHPKLKILEQTNAGFKRKSRICRDCQKEVWNGSGTT